MNARAEGGKDTGKAVSDEIVSSVKLGPEEQWRYSTEFWIEILLRACRTLAEDLKLGWNKVNQALLASAKEGWPGVLGVIDRLDLPYKDARIWASTEAFAGVNAWPGYVDKVTEYSARRTVIRGSGPSEGGRCVILDIAKNLGLEKKIDLAAWCAANADAYLRAISPKLRFVQEKAMCRGDTYDYGYAELVDLEVKDSRHAYQRLRPFKGFQKSELGAYGEQYGGKSQRKDS